MSNEPRVADLYGVPITLLPHIHMRFVSRINNPCSYFEKAVLSRLLGPISGTGNSQSRNLAFWEAIEKVRFRWVLNASALCQAGLGNAKRSTWNTRVNCRPVMVNVTPGSLACGFIRLCPFCYARKCYREFSHLRDILFRPGEDISRRRIIVNTKRFHATVSNTEELERTVFWYLSKVREIRDTAKSQHQLKALAGWFRNQRTWVKKLDDGKYRFVLETMLLGASAGEKGIPVSAFLTRQKEPPDRKTDGLVSSWTWYDTALTKAAFRRWMIRSMRYRPELLSNDIFASMAYNRPMMDLKAQQFYGGGEFRWRAKSATNSEEDFEESSEADE